MVQQSMCHRLCNTPVSDKIQKNISTASYVSEQLTKKVASDIFVAHNRQKKSLFDPTMASGFGDLPDELLLEIFSHMSAEDLALSVQQVSSHWKAVSQDESLWKNKIFSPNSNISDNELTKYLINMPALRAFCLRRGTKSRVISVICDCCKNIRRIEFIFHNRIRNDTLKKMVENLPYLEYLNIPIPKESEQLLCGETLGQFQKLTTLNFHDSYAEITGDILKGVANGCPSLEHIDLGYCTFMDVDFKYFLEKKGQQLLSLTVRCYISTVSHTLLAKCSRLEYLVYEHYNDDLPASYTQILSKLTNLCDMTISYFGEDHARHIPDIFSKQSLSRLLKLHIYDCSQFDGVLLGRVLRNTPLLKKLSIHSGEPLDDGFQYIKMCKQLEHLDVKYCSGITDTAIEHISVGCPKLRHLDVSNCYELTNKTVQWLSDRCQELEYLDLQECNGITDAIFENMKFRKLCHLIISYHDNITGIHFDKIPSNLSSLIEFNVIGCAKLNFDNVNRLQEAMPKLNIVGKPTSNGEENTAGRPASNEEEEHDIELGEATFLISQLM